MSLPPTLVSLLAALSRVFSEETRGWYLFGAQAVKVWGTPRLTADVDVTVLLASEDPAALVLAMRAEGFHLRVRDVEGFVARTRVLPFTHPDSRMDVDVVLAGPGLEEEFLQAARPVDLGGVLVPVICPEDLIVTKILAGRAKDIEDVLGILRERLEELDLSRVRRLLSLLEEALAMGDLTPLFERQLAAVRR